MKIVLASSSAYRKALLARLQLSFTVDAPEIDERAAPGETPEALVRRLSRGKALAVAERHPRSLLIGSDQVAVLDGEMQGKPGGFEDTVAQLRACSGRRVEFLTGLCVRNSDSGREQLDVVRFAVQLKTLSDERIRAYARREQPYGCAGGFKAEGLGVALFERMCGDDPTALIGLPLIRLTEMLEEEGVDPLAGTDAHGAPLE